MTVLDIIKEYLTREGYDGLVNDDADCACWLDDLQPCCCEGITDCEPGHQVHCSGEDCKYSHTEGSCDWHMCPGKRPEAKSG